MPNDIFSELNEKQKEAVQILNGPLLILAGAGSGKTKCLTHRTGNLMINGVPGDQILAVTFTNKAANEMKERIEKLITPDIDTNMPSVGTFHSICVRILRQHIEHLEVGYSRQFVIFDTGDTQSLTKTIIKDHGFNESEIKHRPVLKHISSTKNQLIDIEDYVQEKGMFNTAMGRALLKIYPIYQRKLQEHNALDFDDLLQKTVELLEQKTEVLQYYRKKWNHLMVDEYQDTNFAQYRLVRLLGDEHQNICVIGDDHQSIYSFRGADYTNILNFEKDFPKAKTIKLEQNYRSTKNILGCANQLIGKNQTGLKKKLWTENSAGEKIQIIETSDEKAEGNEIAKRIKAIKEEGSHSYADCAILYRMNAQSRAIEEALMRNQIPYQIIGGTRFFDRREIKDIIAYLRLIFNPKDDVSFLRIINIPSRKIGPSTIETIKEYANQYHLSLFEILEHIEEITDLNEGKKLVLRSFRDLIQELQEKAFDVPISNLIDNVIQSIEYEKYLDDGTAEGEARKQNVQELLSVANKYDDAENSLAAFLEGVALIADVDNYQEESDKVTLMTIHSAKGLEFPVVFLPGWEDGIFPTANGNMERHILEEERRLGYVALTRAEQKCHILNARERMLFGRRQYAQRSQFINDLDPQYIQEHQSSARGSFKSYNRRTADPSVEQYKSNIISSPPKDRKEALWGIAEKTSEFSTGQRVKHCDFGEGTIIMVSGDVLSIAFKGIGVKKLVGSVAPIEIIE